MNPNRKLVHELALDQFVNCTSLSDSLQLLHCDSNLCSMQLLLLYHTMWVWLLFCDWFALIRSMVLLFFSNFCEFFEAFFPKAWIEIFRIMKELEHTFLSKLESWYFFIIMFMRPFLNCQDMFMGTNDLDSWSRIYVVLGLICLTFIHQREISLGSVEVRMTGIKTWLLNIVKCLRVWIQRGARVQTSLI